MNKKLAGIADRITDLTIEGAPTEKISEAVQESMDLIRQSKLATYVTKTECVTAVRLDEHNIQEIGELVKAKYVDECGGPRLILDGGMEAAYFTDWVILGNKEYVEVCSDREFLGKYRSISEALSESERLSDAHKVILEAMDSAKNGDVLSMDDIAMIAARAILSI